MFEIRMLVKKLRCLDWQGMHPLPRPRGSPPIPSEIDLVITDVVMPQMGGIDLVRRLKTDAPDLRVIYMSGYPDGAMVQHGSIDEDMPFLQMSSPSDSVTPLSK